MDLLLLHLIKYGPDPWYTFQSLKQESEMDDSQRGAMYDGWARTKKWIKIEVKELEDGSGWMAAPIPEIVGDPGCVVYGDTKAFVINSIHGKLAAKGYEISNLAEVQGIV